MTDLRTMINMLLKLSYQSKNEACQVGDGEWNLGHKVTFGNVHVFWLLEQDRK